MPRLPVPTLVFFATIFGLPLVQAGIELARGERVQALEVVGPIEESRLRAFEDHLHDASVLHRRVVPAYQWMLTRFLGRGNEKAIVGREDWLYYTQDVEHVTGPGVLQPGQAGGRALKTLVRFRDELADRGVELLLVPVPTKAAAEPAYLSLGANPEPAENPDTEAFLQHLDEAGLEVLDVPALYAELRSQGVPLYLPRDTHWTPATMDAVARAVAARASRLCAWTTPGTPVFRARPVAAAGRGDVVDMLNLPPDAPCFAPMELGLEQVVNAAGEPWQPSPSAAVLLLGDSFTRVFSDPELELGTGSGLAEHLSLALQRPVDVIAMAGGGAAGVRSALARRSGGLAGKRLVVWEFTMRDLSANRDDWRWIDLPPSETAPAPDRPDETAPAEATAAEAAPADRFEVTAELVETSTLDPEFDYAFCLGIFEYRVLSGDHEGPLWVAFPLLVDHEATEAASFAPGLKQHLTLEPIEDHYDLESTSWIDDTDAGWDIFMAIDWNPAE